MHLVNRDLPLVPVLVPVIAIGLFPLTLLVLVGYLGFVALGVLIGFAAVMAQLEEQGAHTRQVISHGSLSRAEQAGYNSDQLALMRSLAAAKIVAAGLVVVGTAGFMLTR